MSKAGVTGLFLNQASFHQDNKSILGNLDQIMCLQENSFSILHEESSLRTQQICCNELQFFWVYLQNTK